jgi:hypothetical protein
MATGFLGRCEREAEAMTDNQKILLVLDGTLNRCRRLARAGFCWDDRLFDRETCKDGELHAFDIFRSAGIEEDDAKRFICEEGQRWESEGKP